METFERQVIRDATMLDYMRNEGFDPQVNGVEPPTGIREAIADLFLDWMGELQDRNWAQRHLGQVRGYVKELDDYIKRGNSFVGEIG